MLENIKIEYRKDFDEEYLPEHIFEVPEYQSWEAMRMH
jgi:hypothetical protein